MSPEFSFAIEQLKTVALAVGSGLLVCIVALVVINAYVWWSNRR